MNSKHVKYSKKSFVYNRAALNGKHYYDNKGHLNSRRRKNIYYDRKKFVKKFSFLSKMKNVWDKLYYASFVNRLVRGNMADKTKPLFYIVDDVHNSVHVSDFLLFNKYWCEFSDVSKKELPLWNFGNFDRDLLALKCAWDQRTTDGLFFSTKLEQARRNWFVSRLFFYVISFVQFVIKFNFFLYFGCFLLSLAMCYVFYKALLTVDFQLYLYYPWFDLYMQNLTLNDRLFVESVSYMQFLYYSQWISDFYFLYFGQGLWSIRSGYFSFQNSWFYVVLNGLYFWIVDWPVFLDKFNAGIVFQLTSMRPTAAFDFYYNFVLRAYDIFLLPHIWDIASELTSYYSSLLQKQISIFLSSLIRSINRIDFAQNIDFYWLYFYKNVISASHWTEYFREWFIVLANDVEAFKKSSILFIKWFKKLKFKSLTKTLTTKISIFWSYYFYNFYMFFVSKFFGLLKWSFNLVYNYLYLQTIIDTILFLLKKVYLYQFIEYLIITPLVFVFNLFYKFLFGLYIGGFAKGVFFNNVYQDLLHDFIYFWLEFLPYNDYIFMRRGTLSYLYSWYIFFPSMVTAFSSTWAVFSHYVPAYTFWLGQYSIYYILQIFPIFIFEHNFIIPLNPKSEWLFHHLGIFSVFDQEYGILQEWFLTFKRNISEDFYGLFYNTYQWLGLVDSQEELFFFFLVHKLDIYLFEFLVDSFLGENVIQFNAESDMKVALLAPFQQELKLVGVINEFIGRVILYTFYATNMAIRSTNFLDFSLLGNLRGFLFSGFFHNSEHYWILRTFDNWLYWKQHFYTFSDERLSSLFKEMQFKLVTLHLFLKYFESSFSTELWNIEKYLNQSNIYMALPDLYWEAYWNLWNSFNLKGWKFQLSEFLDYTTFMDNLVVLLNKPDRVAVPERLDFREVLMALPFEAAQVFGLFHTYEVFKEFGFTRPGNLVNLYNMVEASFDAVAEANYDKPPKSRAFYSIYTNWGWIYSITFFFAFDILPIYELWIGYYVVSSSLGENVAGFHSDMVEKYDIDWVDYAYFKHMDRMSHVDPMGVKNVEFYYKEVMRSYNSMSFHPQPFTRIRTNWFIFDDLYDKQLQLLLNKPWYSSSIPMFFTFNQYWRFIWGYGYSDWVFFDQYGDFFARPLLYTLFIAGRDFFVLGLPIPMLLGSSYVAPFFFFNFKSSLFLLECVFYVIIYIAYFIQLFVNLFVSVVNGNLESFVTLYLIFFSESPLISHTNLNISLFFDFFLWFYDLSLFVTNHFVFWVSAKLTSFIMFYESSTGAFENWRNSLKYFSSYSKYSRQTLVLKWTNNYYLQEISTFYGVFDYYMGFPERSFFNQNDISQISNNNPYLNGFKKTSALVHTLFPFIPDFYNLEDPLIQAEISKILNRTVFIFELFKNKLFDWVDWYSERAFNTSYYRDKYVSTLPVFNILVEVAYNKKMGYFDVENYPFLFKNYVLNHEIFNEYKKLGDVRLFQKDGVLYYPSTDPMAVKKFNSSFAVYNNLGQTRRIQKIFGCWYVYDFFFIFIGFLFLFIGLMATRMFWGVFVFLFDPWETYIVMLYPRLIFHNMHERRDSIALRAEEDFADWLFDHCYFYHQSSDYVFLPYRNFTFETWNRKPSWFFFENNSLDMSLDYFFDLGKPYKENAKKEDYYKKLNKEWDQMKKTTQRLLKVKPNFYFDYNLKFFPMLDLWFLHKDDLKKAHPNIPFFQILSIFLITVVVNFFVYLDFFKSHWIFNWLFIKPDLYFEHFWSTEFLTVWPTFSDYISGLFVIFLLFWFWVVLLYLYRVMASLIEDLCLFTSNLFGFFWVLLVCLLLSTLSSARYWTGRLLSSRFMYKFSGYSFVTKSYNNMPVSKQIGEDLTAFFEKSNDLSIMTDPELLKLYNRSTTTGLAPVYNDTLLTATLLNDALFLADLRQTSLENSLHFVDVNRYISFTRIIAEQGSIISSGKFLPLSEQESLLLFQKFLLIDRFSWNQMAIDFDAANLLTNDLTLLKMYKFNEQEYHFRLFSKYNLYMDVVNKKDHFILFDNLMYLPSTNQNNMLTDKGLSENWGVSAALFQANWSLKLTLNDYFSEWEDIQLQSHEDSFLTRDDIKDFLAYQSKYRPKLVTFEHVPWIVEMFQNPFSDTIVPRVSKLVWPLGGVKPSMSNAFVDLWKRPDAFLGLSDDFLAYRELLERGAVFVGPEQAWGFVDVMNKVGSERNEAFFRSEFYDQLYQEKLSRLALKESWSEFDVSVSSNIEEPTEVDLYDINNAVLNPKYYRASFLSIGRPFFSSVVNTLEGYPALYELPRKQRKREVFEAYDANLIFDLDFGFDYNDLE